MKYYLIIVAKQASKALSKSVLADFNKQLEIRNILVNHVKELAPNEAYEFLIENVNDKNILLNEIKITYADCEFDFFLLEQENYGIKKMLIADMDSTIIANECIDEIAKYVGKYQEVAQITEQAMAGKIKFDQSLLARVSALKAVTKEQLAEIYTKKIILNQGAITVGKTMAKYNCHTVLASGGFTFFTSKIKEKVHFKADYANKLKFIGDELSGYVDLPVFGSDSKLEILLKLAKELNLSTNDIIAVGDGANDLPMLSALDSAIAYKAKWVVKAEILNQINHTDLTSLLYVQGIAKEQFELA